VRQDIGAPMRLYAQESYKRAVADAQVALGDGAFTDAWREGREMPLGDVVRYALDTEGEREP